LPASPPTTYHLASWGPAAGIMSQPGLSPYWRKRRACALNYTKKNKTILMPAVVGPANNLSFTYSFLTGVGLYGAVTCYYAITAYNR